MINNMLDIIKSYFPFLWSRIISYWENSPYELNIELDDGSRFIFDSIDKTIRKLPENYEHLTEQDFRNEFGIRLKKLMWHKGVTQEELSTLTGISQTQISKYFTGKTSPSFYNVDKIAKALNCSVERLLYTDKND